VWRCNRGKKNRICVLSVLGVALGVGLGAGKAGMQVLEYQQNKSRVSRVSVMFYDIVYKTVFYRLIISRSNFHHKNLELRKEMPTFANKL
jgi:hypothetical protein